MTDPPQGYPQQPAPEREATPDLAHPVRLSVPCPESPSRVLALFSIPLFLGRIVAAIPLLFLGFLVLLRLVIIAWIGQWAVLFTGRYPADGHDYATQMLRWQVRVIAWIFGLTDKYPGFDFGP